MEVDHGIKQDIPTKERIIDEALKLFSTKGYVGTSMDSIGMHVGINKASIYSHYKSKDEIYIEVVKKTIDLNLQFFRKTISEYSSGDFRFFFKNFFIKYAEYCYSPYQEAHVKMLKRCALYPPPTVKDKTIKLFDLYYHEIEHLVKPILLDAMGKGILRKISLSDLLDLFNFILDGIYTEVHFTNKRKYFNRVEQVIKVFLCYIEEKPDC